MKVSLLVTCLGDALFPEVGVATVRLLRRLGVAGDDPAAVGGLARVVERQHLVGAKPRRLLQLMLPHTRDHHRARLLGSEDRRAADPAERAGDQNGLARLNLYPARDELLSSQRDQRQRGRFHDLQLGDDVFADPLHFKEALARRGIEDFDAYAETQRFVADRWRDRHAWWRSSVLNTAQMGWFSSDRAIREYAKDIWDVPTI